MKMFRNLPIALACCLLILASVCAASVATDSNPSDTFNSTNSTNSVAVATTTTGYVLLSWSELGMHCMDGKDYSVFSVLPPYNTVYAKLLQKGGKPVPITSGVTVTYQAMADPAGSINTTSSGTSTIPAKTNFWNFVYSLFRAQPLPDTGLKLNRVQSRTPRPMTFNATKKVWEAEGIPTSPRDDAGKTNAYPMIKVVAKNSAGQVIAQSTTVVAVSDEMSCNRCHASNSNAKAMPSGGWVNYTSDPLKDTKLNILKLHDRHVIPAAMLQQLAGKGYNYKSSLYQTAQALNNPILCAACHQSNALNATGMNTGVTGVAQLTTSMHKRHASVIIPGTSTTMDNATSPSASCYQCHPGAITKCQRGAMRNVSCYDCHGNLSRLAKTPRAGWLDEPNCQSCHQNGKSYLTTFPTADRGPNAVLRSSTDQRFATNANVPATGYSLYRFSKGHGSVECSGCHGSQHGEFPTSQANDNVYSTALQGYAGKLTECTVCHTTAPSTTTGGPHGMHTVGQAWISSHHDVASGGGYTQCAACHGADYRGSDRSKLLTAKTFSVDDGRTKTFAAGTKIGCYSCHNGPNGG